MKKFMKPILATVSTLTVATPLVALASCAKGTNVDDARELYIPTFEKIKGSNLSVQKGLKSYYELVTANNSVPNQELRWMDSLLGNFITKKLGEKKIQDKFAKTDSFVKLAKFGGKIDNFSMKEGTITNAKTKAYFATYNSSQCIDVEFRLDIGKLLKEEQKAEEEPIHCVVAGHIIINSGAKVLNTPLSVAYVAGYLPWLDNELTPKEKKEWGIPDNWWYITPDLSDVDLAKDDWGLGYNASYDINIDVNGINLINTNSGFDVYADSQHRELIEEIAKILEEKEKEKGPGMFSMMILPLIKRFLPMAAGWMSYGLSGVSHLAPIEPYVADPTGVEKKDYYRKAWNVTALRDQKDIPELGESFVSNGIEYPYLKLPVSAVEEAIYSFKLNDEPFMEIQGNPQIGTMWIGLTGSSTNESNAPSINLPIKNISSYIDDKIEVDPDTRLGTLSIDFPQATNASFHRRVEDETSLWEDVAKCTGCVPLIYGKNWIYVLPPIDIEEQSLIRNEDGESITSETESFSEGAYNITGTTGAFTSNFTKSFAISKDTYDALNESNEKITFKLFSAKPDVIKDADLPKYVDFPESPAPQYTLRAAQLGNTTSYFIDLHLVLKWDSKSATLSTPSFYIVATWDSYISADTLYKYLGEYCLFQGEDYSKANELAWNDTSKTITSGKVTTAPKTSTHKFKITSTSTNAINIGSMQLWGTAGEKTNDPVLVTFNPYNIKLEATSTTGTTVQPYVQVENITNGPAPTIKIVYYDGETLKPYTIKNGETLTITISLNNSVDVTDLYLEMSPLA